MTTLSSIADTTTLHNGVEMPWLGLGVFKAREGGEVEQAIQWAAEAGYRAVDTATFYNNERGVGDGVRACGVPRAEMFVTTKLWNDDHGYDNALRACDTSLEKLGFDYVDLYLIHWPGESKFVETWKAFETLLDDGRARAIGVSNFQVHHLKELMAQTEVVPMVNQVEFHPHLVQQDLLAFCRDNRIQLEAWSPLKRAAVNEMPVVQQVAERHGKTPAQVTLRWDLQHGVATIPKSANRDRIRENAGIFDFALSEEEVAAIDALDRNVRVGPHPDDLRF